MPKKLKKSAKAKKPPPKIISGLRSFLQKLWWQGVGGFCLIVSGLLVLSLQTGENLSLPFSLYLTAVIDVVGRPTAYVMAVILLLWGLKTWRVIDWLYQLAQKEGVKFSQKSSGASQSIGLAQVGLLLLLGGLLPAGMVIAQLFLQQYNIMGGDNNLSLLAGFWSGLLTPQLTGLVLWLVFGLSLVTAVLLLFMVAGLSGLEWLVLCRWVLAGWGFLVYGVFYIMMVLLGLVVLVIYRFIGFFIPIIKVLLPLPSLKPPPLRLLFKNFLTFSWRRIADADDSLMDVPLASLPPNRATPASPVPLVHQKQSPLFTHPHKKSALPPLSLLQRGDGKRIALSAGELARQADRVKEALLQFGVPGEIKDVKVGPVITLYEFEPKVGVKNARVMNLASDLARALAAVSVRIAPMAGRHVLGIEVPNQNRDKVFLGELLASKNFQESTANLPLMLGKNILGQAMVSDLTTMPHLLMAGTTGSGKSVAMNGFLLSLLYRYGPEDLKLLLIDPKMLELSTYQDIPHLLAPVFTDPKKSVLALLWAVKEMERRYKILSSLGVRNLTDYRQKTKNQASAEPLPFIVVMVDEMADLMLTMGKEVELLVQRLAQMARAAGLHLIMATQRPSVDVITGTIKANFPNRLSYALPTRVDSRTILGVEGAEQLLGQGDFLYMVGGRIERGHAPFTTEAEVRAVADWWRSHGKPNYLPDEEWQKSESGGGGITTGGGEDLYQQAVHLVRAQQKASTSFLQRHLQIGYNRAATLMEQLEKNGVVSPANHAGKREILPPL